MKDKIFYSISFGFFVGILFRSFFSFNIYFLLLIGFLSFFILFFFFLQENKNKWGIVFCFFILMMVLGYLRLDIKNKNINNFYIFSNNQEVVLSGIIVDEVEIRENNQKLTIQVLNQKLKILISTDFIQDFKYGDLISVSGKIKKVENFYTEQGKFFDYINYLKKDGILYLINYPQIEIISSNNGNHLKSFLFLIKNKFLEKIDLTIPHPESLLLGGLILGERASFNESLRQSFIDTGTIHIVALSGYNVTIIAEWIMKLFYFLPNVLGIYLAIFSIFLFVLMTGGKATAIRAGFMAILMLFARATGRNYDTARALVIVAILMIFLNPFILAFDVSFQLSFMATLAVIFLSPKLEKYFLWLPSFFNLRDIASVTFSAYIFVMPFILYKMGNLSLVALPANVLIIPFIPISMLLGFLSGILGFLWHLLSIPFSFLAYLFLHYQLLIVKFFSQLSFASFAIPNFPLLITILIYIYFIYFLFKEEIKNFFKN